MRGCRSRLATEWGLLAGRLACRSEAGGTGLQRSSVFLDVALCDDFDWLTDTGHFHLQSAVLVSQDSFGSRDRVHQTEVGVRPRQTDIEQADHAIRTAAGSRNQEVGHFDAFSLVDHQTVSLPARAMKARENLGDVVFLAGGQHELADSESTAFLEDEAGSEGRAFEVVIVDGRILGPLRLQHGAVGGEGGIQTEGQAGQGQGETEGGGDGFHA